MAAILAAAGAADKTENLSGAAALAAAVEQGRDDARDERLAAVTSELRLIARLAQDEPLDYGTQDNIGRAALRALKALAAFERARAREAVAVNLLLHALEA
jgi:hypothetical protein